MQKICHILMLSILLSLSAVTWASVTPQAGLWSIVSEATGQPGRGLAIDIQGDTLIVTVYGYTKEGRSTFYLASGPYADGKFSGELGMYGGGTALGGERVAAQYLGSAGTVSLVFSSEAEGTVTLPGEGPKAIARFVTYDLRLFYSLGSGSVVGQFFVVKDEQAGGRLVQPYALNGKKIRFKDGIFHFEYDIRENENRISCELSGDVLQLGSSFTSKGVYVCSDNTQGIYQVKDFRIARKDLYSEWSEDYFVSGAFYFTPQGSDVEKVYIMRAGYYYSELSQITPPPYSPPSSPVLRTTISPQNGLWRMADEANGTSGRGIQLDRQGNTLVLAFFGYDEDGHSTFYLASGPALFDSVLYNIESDPGNYPSLKTFPVEFSAELLAFEGGTALGGSYVPAKVIGSKGIVKLKFTSDIDATITLPGELEQAIKRFTAYDASKRLMAGGGKFFSDTSFTGNSTVTTDYEFSMQNGWFDLTVTEMNSHPSLSRMKNICIYSGQYEPTGFMLHSNGRYECTRNYEDGRRYEYGGKYRTTDLTVDEWGVFSGVFQHDNGSNQMYVGGRYIQ